MDPGDGGDGGGGFGDGGDGGGDGGETIDDIFTVKVHYQIGNKTDGFHFWCIPNWEERGMWKIFQVEIEQISRFDLLANILILVLQ